MINKQVYLPMFFGFLGVVSTAIYIPIPEREREGGRERARALFLPNERLDGIVESRLNVLPAPHLASCCNARSLSLHRTLPLPPPDVRYLSLHPGTPFDVEVAANS